MTASSNYQIVPLQAVASQTLQITLSQQACRINVYGKHIEVPTSPPGTIITDPPTYGPIDPVFIDLYVNDTLVIGGVLAVNERLIVRNTYFGFVGDLAFIDFAGSEDPRVDGLGSRWQLTYWADLP